MRPEDLFSSGANVATIIAALASVAMAAISLFTARRSIEEARRATADIKRAQTIQAGMADELGKIREIAEEARRVSEKVGTFELRARELRKLSQVITEADATGIPPTPAELSEAWALGRRLFSHDQVVQGLSDSLYKSAAKWAETSETFDDKGDRDVFFATSFALQNACLNEMAPFVSSTRPTGETVKRSVES